MELIVVLWTLLMIVLTVVAKLSERKQRRKAIRDAYSFNPGNVHGGAKFAGNDDLRKAGLFK